MEKKKRGCCSAQHCPCYPNCDEVMEQRWQAQQNEEKQTEPVPMEQLQTEMLNRDPGVLRQLAMQDEADLARLKELYPMRVRQILEEVEHVCDSMEYEGSVMFDEMPEKQRIMELTDGIEQKMQDKMTQWEEELQRQQEEDIYVMNHPMAPPQPPYPSQPPRPPYPPRQVNWFRDLIQVLLQDEMYHRRCRNRNCRRW